MTSLPPAREQQRLERLLDHASKHASNMNKLAVQASVDIGKEKTQYFEKIALACAGTIALVVSFVGSHAAHLQPAWPLRCALITLVAAMIAAMYRNWTFSFYAFASFARQDLAAKQNRERARRDYVVAIPAVAMEDGKPIDVKQWLPQFEKGDKLYGERIAERERQEDSSFVVTKHAEYVALVLRLHFRA